MASLPAAHPSPGRWERVETAVRAEGEGRQLAGTLHVWGRSRVGTECGLSQAVLCGMG